MPNQELRTLLVLGTVLQYYGLGSRQSRQGFSMVVLFWRKLM